MLHQLAPSADTHSEGRNLIDLTKDCHHVRVPRLTVIFHLLKHLIPQHLSVTQCQFDACCSHIHRGPLAIDEVL